MADNKELIVQLRQMRLHYESQMRYWTSHIEMVDSIIELMDENKDQAARIKDLRGLVETYLNTTTPSVDAKKNESPAYLDDDRFGVFRYQGGQRIRIDIDPNGGPSSTGEPIR